MTYAAVIAKARQEVKIQEMGIDKMKMRVSQTGARILEVSGSTSGEKADLLAAKLKSCFRWFG